MQTWPRMFRFLMSLVVIGSLAAVDASAAALPRDVGRWTEIVMPPASKKADRDVWMSAANWAEVEWRAFSDAGHALAERKNGQGVALPVQPEFLHGLARFGRVDAYTLVKDGWLVAFDRGGFGAALYWFSSDGARNEKISGQHIGGFFAMSTGMHAIEGSTQPGSRSGSVIRIEREAPGKPWRTTTIARLSNVPEAVSAKSDGTALITLSDALVSIDATGKLRSVVTDAPWQTLFPNSSTLSADQRHLYIGMRQYVADVDLTTHRQRFLIPDRALLNKLSAQDERSIRGYMVFKVVRNGAGSARGETRIVIPHAKASQRAVTEVDAKAERDAL